jgi:hypothetical protein
MHEERMRLTVTKFSTTQVPVKAIEHLEMKTSSHNRRSESQDGPGQFTLNLREQRECIDDAFQMSSVIFEI